MSFFENLSKPLKDGLQQFEDVIRHGAEDGDQEFVQIPASITRTQLLIPNQTMTVDFEPRTGPVRINVVCQSKEGTPGTGTQGKPHPDPNHPDFDKVFSRGLPVTITVRRPGNQVEIIRLESTGVSADDVSHATIEVPESLARRAWRLTFRPDRPVRCQMNVLLTFVGSRHLVRTTRIPFSLLNGAASELLKGMALDVRIDRGRVSIHFSEDLRKHAGIDLDAQFGVDKLRPVRNLRLTSVGAAVRVDGATGRPVFDVFARVGGGVARAGPFGFQLVSLGARTRFEVHHRRGTRNIGYRATAEVGVLVGATNFATQALGELVKLVDRTHLGPLRLLGLTDVKVDVDSVIEALRDLGKTQLEKTLNAPDVRSNAGRFVTEGLMMLSERGHVLNELATSSDALLVKHFDPRTEETQVRTRTISFPQDTEQPAPAEQDVRAAELLREKIDHIVVLMMENRSFDHILGHLPMEGRDDVDGLDGTETNTGIRVEEDFETRFEFNPDHSFEGVLEQINNGRMDGFVRNFIKKFGHETFIDRVNPMGFYTGDTLPAYKFLAEHYLVCNKWYCSHPGPTWPNRFCTVAGRAPEVENFNADDERIGYMNFGTMYDLLEPEEWVNYEHDIAFLRMFDRYRLDDRQIRPFDEFFTRAQTGLPLLTFIDPDYTDVVPGDRVANDDHAPADLMQGQRLVARVYNALQASPGWERTMFVITYDEHGGFFDHVPPPGTLENPDDSIAPIHPEGKKHLGPRVPTIVISPWVPAGADSTRFEHTSIMKTLLLRRFGPEHPNMGPRVQQSNNLGLLLTNEQPRLDVGPMEPIDPVPEPPPPGELEPGPKPLDDFHEAIRQFSVPVGR